MDHGSARRTGIHALRLPPKPTATQAVLQSAAAARPVLLRCLLRLRRIKGNGHLERVAPPLARWLFVGRSLGLDGRLWRLVPRTPIAPLGHSLRRVGGGRRVLSGQRSFVALRSFLPCVLRPLLPRIAAACVGGRALPAPSAIKKGDAHPRLRLDRFWGGCRRFGSCYAPN